MRLWPILSNKRSKIRQKNSFVLKIWESDYNKCFGIPNTLIHKKNQPNPVVSYAVMANFVK